MAARRLRPDLITPTRRALLGGVASCLAAPAFAAPAPQAGWVPFDDSEGLIRFEGAIGEQRVMLTLDSGAGRVVIDQAFARQIGLEAVDRSGALHGFAESRPGALSGPVKIVVGGGQLNLPNAVLADLSALRAGGLEAPVLIGRDIFELVSVDIDFVSKRIAFRPPGSFATSDFRRIPLRGRKDVRQVQVAVEGRPPVWAILDLGSGSALAMSKDYARSINLFDGRPTSAWISTGIDGTAAYDVGRASRVAVAGAVLHDVPFDAYPVWNRAAIAPANIGYPLLRRLGRIIIDYGSDSLFVARSAPPPEPFGRNRTGLALAPLEPGYRVAFVAPGSPADRGDWKAGDRIVAINGRPTLTGRELSALGRQRRVNFTMADGSVRDLVPGEYY